MQIILENANNRNADAIRHYAYYILKKNNQLLDKINLMDMLILNVWKKKVNK